MRKVAALALLLGLLAAVGFSLIGDRQTDEEQVRELVRTVAEGAETADLSVTMGPLSKRFYGEGMSYEDLWGFLFRQYNARGPITTVLGPIAVQLEGETGTAEVDVTLMEGLDPGSLKMLPDQADLVHFRLGVELEDGDWKIVSAERW